ncbi:uncharacterized protein LOC127866868 [Dreissena polymorpha]|uniref:Uncharacterized protein n=1 Tax=Dreissena polymorpha TaxID=45954 RepID=A0A9D4LV74_DREPO|nr:uncharacterized protein LOC127866868 [Dreissena polymorpha]KAH3864414.1 hypothetical protein DPMN_027432 [Dreissena polymorpha]
MYTILTLLACVGVSLAAQCCVPPQWTSMASFLTAVVRNGKPYYSRGLLSIGYDAVRHRIGQYVSEQINNGANSMAIGVLLDYQANLKWVKDVNSGKCYKMPLNRKLEDFVGCISENATVVGNKDAFGFDSNVMTLNTYSMDYPGLRVYTSLTSDSCVPVGETFSGSIDGHSFIENVHYYNVSAGLSTNPADDPLVVPPRGCETASNFDGNFHYLGLDNIIGRRSAFSILGF